MLFPPIKNTHVKYHLYNITFHSRQRLIAVLRITFSLYFWNVQASDSDIIARRNWMIWPFIWIYTVYFSETPKCYAPNPPRSSLSTCRAYKRNWAKYKINNNLNLYGEKEIHQKLCCKQRDKSWKQTFNEMAASFFYFYISIYTHGECSGICCNICVTT